MTDKSTPSHGPSSQEKRSKLAVTPFAIIWAGLAALSLVYLALLTVQPELVASYLGSRSGSVQDAERQRVVSAAVTEVEKLRGDVEQIKGELGRIKSEAATQLDRDRQLIERVAALEAPPATPAQRIAAAKAAAKVASAERAALAAAQAPAPDAAQAQPAAAPPVQPAAQPAKVDALPPVAAPGPQAAALPAVPGAAKVTKPAARAKAPAAPAPAVPAAGALETGSLGASPATGVNFGAAVVTPAEGVAQSAPPAPAQQGVGIQIATGPSVDSLRLSWALLAARHSAELSGLQPRYKSGSNAQGPAFDLVAGPIPQADAQRICQDLAAQGTPCATTSFKGNAL